MIATPPPSPEWPLVVCCVMWIIAALLVSWCIGIVWLWLRGPALNTRRKRPVPSPVPSPELSMPDVPSSRPHSLHWPNGARWGTISPDPIPTENATR
jgi:hypothetical protein